MEGENEALMSHRWLEQRSNVYRCQSASLASNTPIGYVVNVRQNLH